MSKKSGLEAGVGGQIVRSNLVKVVLVAVSQKGTAWQLAVPREFCQIGKGWQGVAGWQMREIIHFSYWLLPIYILCLLEYIVTL